MTSAQIGCQSTSPVSAGPPTTPNSSSVPPRFPPWASPTALNIDPTDFRRSGMGWQRDLGLAGGTLWATWGPVQGLFRCPRSHGSLNLATNLIQSADLAPRLWMANAMEFMFNGTAGLRVSLSGKA